MIVQCWVETEVLRNAIIAAPKRALIMLNTYMYNLVHYGG